MASLTAEVITSFNANSSTSACLEVLLSLAEPMVVSEGLLNSLPPPPVGILSRDGAEATGYLDLVPSVWTQLEHYCDCFRRAVSLCKRRSTQEASIPIIKRWRASVSSLLEAAVESGSDVYWVGVSFGLIKVVFSSKDFDDPSEWMQLATFNKVSRTISCSLEKILKDLTNQTASCANSSNQDNNNALFIPGLFCDWLHVSMEMLSYCTEEASPSVGRISTSILQSLQQLVLNVMESSFQPPSSLTMMCCASTLHCVYERLHSLSSKWQKLVHLSSQIATLAEWVWQHYDDLIGRLSAYQIQLFTFSILQDANSQDWSNTKPFYEGQRISFHIQMWRFHILGLRADLWRHAPPEAAIRVLRKVLSSTLDTLTLHYSSITASESRQQQYKGDVLFILLSTSSLLPSITDPSHLSPPDPLVVLIHTHCSTLLSLVSAISRPLDGGNVTSLWQETLPLDHYGINGYHGNNTIPEIIQSIVSLPYPSWDTIIKLLLQNQCQYAVEVVCSVLPSLCPHVMNVLQHCHHHPMVLDTFVRGVEPSEESSKLVMTWIVGALTPLIDRPISDAAVQFVLAGVRDDTESFLTIIGSLVDHVDVIFDEIGSPLLVLLKSMGQKSDKSFSKLFGTIVSHLLHLEDTLMSKIPIYIRKWYRIFCDVLNHLFPFSEMAGDLLTSEVLTPKDLERIQEKVRRMLQEKPTVQLDFVEVDSLNSVAYEVVSSSDKDMESLRKLYKWITTNNSASSFVITNQFDPVAMCCSIGSQHLDHKGLLEDWGNVAIT